MMLTCKQADELRKIVWEMRQSGMTLAAIGKQINRSQEEVRRLEFMQRQREERSAALHGLTVSELMHRSILELELPARARNVFEYGKKYTVADVMAISDEELSSSPNFGKVTVAATRAAIDKAIADAKKVERNDC